MKTKKLNYIGSTTIIVLSSLLMLYYIFQVVSQQFLNPCDKPGQVPEQNKELSVNENFATIASGGHIESGSP